MISVGKALSLAKATRTLSDDFELFSKVRLSWAEIAGKMASEFTPDAVRRGVLVLVTSNPIWRAEFDYIKGIILSQLKHHGQVRKIVDIQLVFKECEVTETNAVVPPVGVGLEVLIINENRSKRGAGMANCSTCNDVLTDQAVCVFCRSK